MVFKQNSSKGHGRFWLHWLHGVTFNLSVSPCHPDRSGNRAQISGASKEKGDKMYKVLSTVPGFKFVIIYNSFT